MAKFVYSRGTSKFDNLPQQLSADSFAEFARAILKDVSKEKGQAYICAAVSKGRHSDPEKNRTEDHWRQQHLALPRQFLAFDFDGFESPTVWEELRTKLPWKAFLYTTASHTAEKPRARAFVELDREVDHDEGVELGASAQAYLENLITTGSIQFDISVYRSTQPIYTPVVGFETFLVKGEPLNVRAVLPRYPVCPAINAVPPAAIAKFSQPQAHRLYANDSVPIPPGERNSALLQRAGYYRRHGMLQQSLEAQLVYDNETLCHPPLDNAEVLDIARRYMHQGSQKSSIFNDVQRLADTRQSELTSNGSRTGVFALEDGEILLASKPPPPRDYVFASTVIKGSAIMLGGLGGTAKTMLAMQICVAAALGQQLGALQVREGCSVLFLGEESADERNRRFGGLSADLRQDDRDTIAQRIRAFPAIGKDLRLTLECQGNPQPTVFADEVIGLSLRHEESCGVPLSFIVLDHARMVMAGDPNAADDVSQLTRVLAYIANKTQAVVVLIAHSPKSAMSKEAPADASEIFGSGAFTDNTRGTFVLHTMRPDEAKRFGINDNERSDHVCLTNVKANYGKSGVEWWFRKEPVAAWQIVKLVPELLFNTNAYPQYSALSRRILDAVKASPGQLTRANLRDRSGKQGSLGASEKEVRNTLDRLIQEGQLIPETLSKAEKVARGLSANTQEVLTLPGAGQKVLGAGLQFLSYPALYATKTMS